MSASQELADRLTEAARGDWSDSLRHIPAVMLEAAAALRAPSPETTREALEAARPFVERAYNHAARGSHEAKRLLDAALSPVPSSNEVTPPFHVDGNGHVIVDRAFSGDITHLQTTTAPPSNAGEREVYVSHEMLKAAWDKIAADRQHEVSIRQIDLHDAILAAIYVAPAAALSQAQPGPVGERVELKPTVATERCYVTCAACGGSGRFDGTMCIECQGDGSYLDNVTTEYFVDSPAGVAAKGKTVRELPPVERIEMVNYESGFREPADPEWRVNVAGYCADFQTETAANNFRNAILTFAALPGVAAKGETWRPIETAPKDGSIVLVCGHGDSKDYYVADAKWDGEWMLFDPSNDDWTEPTFGATHWMPLPPPPVAVPATDGDSK